MRVTLVPFCSVRSGHDEIRQLHGHRSGSYAAKEKDGEAQRARCIRTSMDRASRPSQRRRHSQGSLRRSCSMACLSLCTSNEANTVSHRQNDDCTPLVLPHFSIEFAKGFRSLPERLVRDVHRRLVQRVVLFTQSEQCRHATNDDAHCDDERVRRKERLARH